MLALVDMGNYRLAPDSKIQKPSKKSWENWTDSQRERFFMKAVCTRKPKLGQCGETITPPQMPDLTNLSQNERKEVKKAHKEAMRQFNEAKKEKRLEHAFATGMPVLNVSSQVKQKPHQKNRPTANRTRSMYNHYPTRGEV